MPDQPPDQPTSRPTKRPRSSFGPVMLAGLGTAGLMAVAASQTWLHATGNAAAVAQTADISGSDAAPLGLALALVALAGWGVVLVSRTRARRAAAVVGLLATLGVLAVVITLWPDADSVAQRVLTNQGASGTPTVEHRPWYWITAVAAIAQAVVLVVAVRAAPSWPTMSSRYDAPGERLDAPVDAPVPAAEDHEPAAAGQAPEPTAEPAEIADLELWKALDEGRDPTRRAGH